MIFLLLGRNIFHSYGVKRYNWKQIRITFDWTNIFDTQNYLTAYYNDISAYRHVYDIRPSQVLLKVRLKLK